jgi:hypothetical protein
MKILNEIKIEIYNENYNDVLQHFFHNENTNNEISETFKWNVNPFPADVANKRHLGSAPKSHLCDLTGKTV